MCSALDEKKKVDDLGWSLMDLEMMAARIVKSERRLLFTKTARYLHVHLNAWLVDALLS